MNQITLNKVQAVQLEIAKRVKDICEKYEIKYFLYFGTLLGAIRHKGFIPWDDDMDIGMLRIDYEKFLKIAQQELGDQYFLQTWDTDPHYWQPYAKVRKNGTLYVEKMTRDIPMHKGIFIDIFPLDAYPNNERMLKIVRKRVKRYGRILFIQRSLNPWALHSSFIKKVMSFGRNASFVFLSKIMSEKRLKEKYELELTSCRDKFEVFVNMGMGGDTEIHCIPKEWFENMVSEPFEDTAFTCLARSREVLQMFYGDYMQLPPVEKRQKTHDIIEVRL